MAYLKPCNQFINEILFETSFPALCSFAYQLHHVCLLLFNSTTKSDVFNFICTKTPGFLSWQSTSQADWLSKHLFRLSVHQCEYIMPIQSNTHLIQTGKPCNIKCIWVITEFFLQWHWGTFCNSDLGYKGSHDEFQKAGKILAIAISALQQLGMTSKEITNHLLS